ncbi:hypothetical protein [Anaerotignum propionicum]|uniref:hypothetical protein n=1 Tax=Anaerotignum propionicum TaxID=28446 RepID=UPI0028A049A1|nr:hypothetical protein [Anaerotignum propionicum]
MKYRIVTKTLDKNSKVKMSLLKTDNFTEITMRFNELCIGRVKKICRSGIKIEFTSRARMNKKRNLNEANIEDMTNKLTINELLCSGPFYHGTKASLKLGDLLKPNYKTQQEL